MLIIRPRRLTAVAAVLAGALTLSLASCSSNDPSSTAAPSSSPSPSHAAPVTTEQLAKTIAAAAVAANSVQIRARINDASELDTLEGSMTYLHPSYAGDFTLTRRDGTTDRMIITEKSNVVSGSDINTRGKKWIDFEKTDDVPLVMMEWVTRLIAIDDPAGLLNFGKSVSLTDSGSSSVPGTTQYTATLTPQQFAASFGKGELRSRTTWMTQRGATGGQLIVNVNEEGLPTRLLVIMSPSSAQYTAEVQFLGWGDQVTITPPPASQVHH